MLDSLRGHRAVLGLVVVLVMAGCAGVIDDDDDVGTPESTPVGEAVVPDEDAQNADDEEVELLESFVESLEQEDVDVLDSGVASDGFVGLVYRHDESTVEADIEGVAETYSRIAATDTWSPDELRVMTIDDDGDPVTTYRIETAAARAYDNGSITREEYWDHIGDTYDVVQTDTPTSTPSPEDDGGFHYPDEDDDGTPTPTSGSAATPEPTPTATPTPTPEEDDDGVPDLP